jgi:alkylation response protein AidB-like acyl-CoA dehydrogenase
LLAGRLGDLGHPAPVDACVVLPTPRRAASGRLAADGRLEVNGMVLGPRQPASSFVVPVGNAGAVSAVALVASPALSVREISGLDATLACASVTGEVRPADMVAEGSVATRWWARTEALGRLALCHDLAATLRAMLELARVHALERTQFGQPVGTFQAVRHKLAEALVVTISAESAAAAAWEADDFELAAATAKLVASNSVALVARHTQQVLAGIGFTAEHPFQLRLKRATALDRVLGSEAELAPWVGGQLAGRSSIPRLISL